MTTCDVVVAASVSNWGAYGIGAYMGCALGLPDLVQDEDTERLMLESCVLAGCTDSIVGAQVPAVDGIPSAVNLAFVRMLRGIVTTALKVVNRGF